jgi:hypothetical protein
MTSIRTANNRRKAQARRRGWSSLREFWLWQQYGPASKRPRRMPTKSKRKLLAAYRQMSGLFENFIQASAQNRIIESMFGDMFHSGGVVKGSGLGDDELPVILQPGSRLAEIDERRFAVLRPGEEFIPKSDVRLVYKPIPLKPEDAQFLEVQRHIQKTIRHAISNPRVEITAKHYPAQEYGELIGKTIKGETPRIVIEGSDDDA